jgi:hypothetical protein
MWQIFQIWPIRATRIQNLSILLFLNSKFQKYIYKIRKIPKNRENSKRSGEEYIISNLNCLIHLNLIFIKYVQMGPIAIDYFFYSKGGVDLLPPTRAYLSGIELHPSATAIRESHLKWSEIGRLSQKLGRPLRILHSSTNHPNRAGIQPHLPINWLY